MEYNRKKRTGWPFLAVPVIICFFCLFTGVNVNAKVQKQYTSVTVELRDADTGEVFDTYVHPWQCAGKNYTYYMDEKIYQKGKGCYWYDKSHEGTISQIQSLSRKAEENRIVLFYKLYVMNDKEYAVNVTWKDSDTDETLRTELQLFQREAFSNGTFCEENYAYDMDYCITGENGETYLYDFANEKNVSVVKLNLDADKNQIGNQIILYYRKGTLKEGETAAEVRYQVGDALLKKDFVTGLPVGAAYQMDEDAEDRGWKRDDILYVINDRECRLMIDALTVNPAENAIELQYIVNRVIGGWQSFVFFPVRYVDRATGDVILEEQGVGIRDEMFCCRPVQVLRLASGTYYFDNTCSDHVMQVDGRKYDPLQNGSGMAHGGITVYYRADKKPGDYSDVNVDYLNSTTGQVLKTEKLHGMEVGKPYRHTPEASFDWMGKQYLFEREFTGNVLELEYIFGQPDLDRIVLYYTECNLPVQEKKMKTGRVLLSEPVMLAGGKLKLKWKKVSGANGYQIIYAYNKQFKKAKKITTKKNTVMLKGIKDKKVCYVKVRAYKLDSAGKRVYGKYSKKEKARL